ncbi:MAG: glycosyltransferase [Chloroflexota bacterium]|nr:glycosyltransferase [Chloroflexota bacterium]
MAQPLVSVIVVNYNGSRHLEPCFGSLLKQTYPVDQLELILVDNASSDDSLALMAARFPQVRVIANATNVGFAPAVNQGVAAASGKYAAFINNDAYADPQWLHELVTIAETQREAGVVCVGAKMLDWHGQRIDFVGGGVNFYGHGDQFFHQLPTDAVQVGEQELLFACGGAMLIDRDVFLEIGGFDADYFAYFEDIDLGWRLWLLGYRVVFAPQAVVYHRQHATSNTMYGYQIRTLLERNALMTIIKNYDEDNLQRVLPVALMLLVKKTLLDSNDLIDRREFDVRERKPGVSDSNLPVPKRMLAFLVAAGDVVDDFDQIWHKRQQIQARRKRPDSEILPLFRRPMGPNDLNPGFLLLQEKMTEAFDIRGMFGSARTTRVLVVSSDPLYENLAGPGIRAVEMSRYLAQSCHVTLAAPEQARVSIPDVEAVHFQRGDQEALQVLASHAEVIIVQGLTLTHYPVLKMLNKILVIDLYDPFHLENLQIHTEHALEHAPERAMSDVRAINEQLQSGDFFICASERQRDFWLGALGTLGRLTPSTYCADPSFRSLIDTVPFGLDPHPPVHRRSVMKGVVPGIDANDTVVLWGGGIWDWLDPLTVIRAMALIRAQRSDIKLFFLGMRHPNPADVPEMLMYERAVTLAAELGLLNQTVFFNDRWVPYAERENYFLEADIGVSAHLEHVETRFAFRTRLLDYIWAGLPMVVAAGDTLADVVAQRGLGHVVAIEDEAAFATAILALAGQAGARSAFGGALATAQQEFAWPKVLQPLIAFCRQPRYARDTQQMAESDGRLAGGTVLPSLQKRMDELDAVVAQKNEHIAYLEGLLKQIEAGRVMRVLRRFGRG